MKNSDTQRPSANAESWFVKTLDTIRLIGVMLDRKGVITYCNPWLLERTGWTQEEILGQNWFDLFIPDDIRSTVAAVFDRTIEDKSFPPTFENEILCRSGERRYVRWHNTTFASSSGALVGVACLGEDLTEQRDLERRSRAQSDLLGTILRTLPNGTGMVDAGRRIRWTNDAMSRLSGYPIEEIVGRHVRFLHESDADYDRVESEARAQIVATGRASVEARLRRFDGTLVDVIVTTCPLATEEAGMGVVFALLDVSESRRAREALETQHAQHLAILESFPEVLYVADPVTHEVLFANGRTRELVGHNPVGERCHRAFHGLDTPCQFCNNERLIRDDQPMTWEFHNDYLGLDFLITDQLIRWPGGRIVRFEVAIDITERRALERRYLQAQKMEAIGQLAGGVAHDFNNILQAAMGYTELLGAHVDATGNGRAYLNDIVAALERATNLTRQLLAFGRRQTMMRQPVELPKLVADVMRMLKRVIGEDIELIAQFDPTTPRINADPGQLEQVLLNLCVNARDAMPRGGRLTIRTSAANLDEGFCDGHASLHPGRYARLEVIDDGDGMDDETIAHVFEPFFTTKEVGHGTGLGLASVFGIVKHHDGLVTAQSTPGEGSSFSVFLPVTNEDLATVTPRPHQFPIRGTETVLLAEDDPQIRRVTVRILEHAGYKVIVACDGAEAIAQFHRQRSRIDIVILDAVMPEHSGIEVFREIRADAPNLPVLFTSGYSEDWLGTRRPSAEEATLLTKPYASNELLRTLRTLLDGTPPAQ